MAEFLYVRSTITSTNSLNSFFEINKKIFYIEVDRRRHIHIDWVITRIKDAPILQRKLDGSSRAARLRKCPLFTSSVWHITCWLASASTSCKDRWDSQASCHHNTLNQKRLGLKPCLNRSTSNLRSQNSFSCSFPPLHQWKAMLERQESFHTVKFYTETGSICLN